MPPSIPPGRYRHYKGKDYQVLGCARHSETEEEFVVYRALYGEKGLWIRPLAMFVEMVTVGTQRLPRFELIKADVLETSPGVNQESNSTGA